MLKSVKWLGVVVLFSLLSACGGESSDSVSNNKKINTADNRSVALQYDMSALLAQKLQSGIQSLNTAFSSDQILRGQLSVTTIGGVNDGQQQTFAWTIFLNEDTFQASSNNTLSLTPGNYDFELLLTRGDQQYAGYSNQTINDGENDVAMTIKPVIGDTVSDVTIIDRLAYFKFQYTTSDLAALTSPAIGIEIDSAAEQLFSINKSTGLSDTFVNLPTGSHTLKLKLYDASVQVGKSVVAQELQTIAFGTDLTMDIVPLHGELQFILTEDGGDANLTVNAPAEVINEVGGVANLTATLALVGVKNPLQETALMFVQQPSGDYSADVVLTDLQYEDVTISMTFTDTTTTDQVADCSHAWTLNNQNQSFTCDITLIRRAVVNGSIMSVLAINVINEQGEPVSGAVVTNGAGDTLGITGSGSYGTAGYLKVYLPAGDYDITATETTTSHTQSASINLTPLEIENLLLELAAPVPVGFDGDFAQANWTFSGVASYNMSGDTFSISSGAGGITATTTIQTAGTISFDWNINVFSAGQYGDSINYILNGQQVSLSTAGTASGTGVSIAVQAGDEFKLSTWGSTQSSSYSAAFTNFNFTAN